jgi:hypothetical protein
LASERSNEREKEKQSGLLVLIVDDGERVALRCLRNTFPRSRGHIHHQASREVPAAGTSPAPCHIGLADLAWYVRVITDFFDPALNLSSHCLV